MTKCQTKRASNPATVHPSYIYLGDRMTDESLKGQRCTAVRQANGLCIRGRNGNMLVKFSSGRTAVVVAKRLRKIKDGVTGEGE